MHINILFLFMVSLFMTNSSSATEIKAERFSLDNGLQVQLLHRPALPITTISLSIKAGQLFEKEGQEGLAGFTVDLLDQGTTTKSAEEIAEELEFMGTSFGSGVRDDIVELGLQTLKRNIDRSLDIFADILLHPSFSEEELRKQKDETLSALTQEEEDPGHIAMREFLKEIYGKHPYSHNDIGNRKSVTSFNRQVVRSFYETYYIPNGSVLTVVGDFDHDSLVKKIQQRFGEWRKGKPPVLPPEPRDVKGRAVKIIDKDISQANILLGYPAISRKNPDYYKVVVMNYILGSGGFASRMLKDLRDEKGLTYGVYSRFSLPLEKGYFVVSVQTKNKSAEESIKGILYHLRKMKSEEVTDKEYQEAIAYLTGSFPLRLDTNHKISGILGAMAMYELGDDYLDTYVQRIRSVTKKDILEVAKKYLHPESYRLVIVGNGKELNRKRLTHEFK